MLRRVAAFGPFVLAVPFAYLVGRSQGPGSRAVLASVKLSDVVSDVNTTGAFLVWTLVSFLAFVAASLALWMFPGALALASRGRLGGAPTLLGSTLLGFGFFVAGALGAKLSGAPLATAALLPLAVGIVSVATRGWPSVVRVLREVGDGLFAQRRVLAFGMYAAALLVLCFRHQLNALPYVDEFYRLQFVVVWRDFAVGENALFHEGSRLLYYTLAELTTAVISALTSLEPAKAYFLGLLPFAWFLLFVGVGTAMHSGDGMPKASERASAPRPPVRRVLLSSCLWAAAPFALVGLLIAHDAALGHFFMRQTVLGMAFALAGLTCLAPSPQERSSRSAEVGLLFGLVALTVATKPPFALLLSATAGAMLIGFDRGPLWKRLLLAVALLLAAQTLTTLLTMGGPRLTPRLGYFEALRRSFPPSEFFLTWLPPLPPHALWTPPFVVILQGLVIAPLVVFGLAAVALFKLFRPLDHGVVFPVSLAVFTCAGWSVFAFLFIPASTGGSEHYFQFAATYSSAIATLVVASGLRGLASGSVRVLRGLALAGVLAGVGALVAFAPRVLQYERHLPSVEDRDFVRALRWIREETPRDAIVVHNVARDPMSVAITALAERRQYLGYVHYGGTVTEPNWKERLDTLDAWLDGGLLPTIFCSEGIRKRGVFLYVGPKPKVSAALEEIALFGRFHVAKLSSYMDACGT